MRLQYALEMMYKQKHALTWITGIFILATFGCSPKQLPLKNKPYELDAYDRETITFFGDSVQYTIFCPIGSCEIVYKGKYEAKKKTRFFTIKKYTSSFSGMFEAERKMRIRIKSERKIYLDKARFGLWPTFDQILYEKSIAKAVKLIRRYKKVESFYDEVSYQKLQIDTVTFLDFFVPAAFEKMMDKNIYYAAILPRLGSQIDSTFNLNQDFYDPEFQAAANETFDRPLNFSNAENVLRFSGKTHFETATMYAPPKDFGYLLQSSRLFDLNEDSYAMVVKVSKLSSQHQLAFTFQYNKKTLKLEDYGVIGLRVCP